MLENIKSRARGLKKEVITVFLATKDPRTPWYARAVALCTVAYAFSPIDLIPDFIPILGYLDDLLIVPAGIALAIRLIPAEVLEEARGKAEQVQGPAGSVGYIGAMAVIAIWILATFWVVHLVMLLLDIT